MILGLALMLLPADVAAIQGSRLLPNGQTALHQIAATRAAIASTIIGFTFGPSTTTEVIAYDFPPNTITLGTQVRIHLYGAVLNNDPGFGPQQFEPSLVVVNSGTGSAVVDATGWMTPYQAGTSVAWKIDATYSFNLLLDPDPTAPRPLPGSSPSPILRVDGELGMTQTDITISGVGTPAVVGGVPLVAPTDTSQSVLVTTSGISVVAKADTGATTHIALVITTGANASYTVRGGWLEVL